MGDFAGQVGVVGYCMNVHAAGDLADVVANIRDRASRVSSLFGRIRAGSLSAPDAAAGTGLHPGLIPGVPGVPGAGVGVWLPRGAVPEVGGGDHERRAASEALSDALAAAGVRLVACNGFPFEAFHDPVVKHRVYTPDWTTEARRDYTIDLAHLLAGVRLEVLARPLTEPLPGKDSGSFPGALPGAGLLPGAGVGISTVPVGWPGDSVGDESDRLALAGVRIAEVIGALARLEEETGRWLMLELEPEPGCLLDTSDDLVDFVERFVLRPAGESATHRYLGVCHDVCHAAVMGEDQRECLLRYIRAGITVGRLQVSSAVQVDPARRDPAERSELLETLRKWAEPRYLHQTMIHREDTGEARLFDDLPEAIAAAERDASLLDHHWRIHFHVPLFMDRIGALNTTQSQIDECLAAAQLLPTLPAVEAETYAWHVLPKAGDTTGDIEQGIARELAWLSDRLVHHGLARAEGRTS
ncbi:MAG: sugar phosphate isomerase/epimerase [Phycisphaeraceae bacterium]|nr:sugar phosphate isomerase/epimerase [Phycisphaeraceae bacterium]